MLEGWIQIVLTLLIVVAITPFFGRYMAQVYQGQRTWFDPLLDPLDRLILSISGAQTREK
jgi:K+-transporting ATPase ATPase A chain